MMRICVPDTNLWSAWACKKCVSDALSACSPCHLAFAHSSSCERMKWGHVRRAKPYARQRPQHFEIVSSVLSGHKLALFCSKCAGVCHLLGLRQVHRLLGHAQLAVQLLGHLLVGTTDNQVTMREHSRTTFEQSTCPKHKRHLHSA